ncbi:winged helix DNA-binding domain protein [Anoxybacillus sp. B7M1]|jgi:MarR family transcriptional regulator, organic hydroperoxide resistance regulator|uniref:MarR family winged helix-turn-helix transcriptional regulator n=1 Tax=unclassified Anoxybacillus TaxID=2639704 RepID=UPI0005CD6582|nr:MULTISPECIES: MarR family transcriptional regulator [unclassified Anoxybacillus]ANB56071.1 winged helix DNA-binding domain protein [Anoxybacillus sp. B2M1]ANB64530.1 winged helix DNA-binding domain protein [Anoxybacillus sp. B7M1]
MPVEMDEKAIAELEKSLRYIAAILKRKGREVLVRYPITRQQFIALQLLFEEGDMTIGELSNKMELACSTTTDLIDRMEKNKLVTRVKDQKDRRVVRIHLLHEGERIIREVIKKRQHDLALVLKNFSAEEVALLEESLKKLHQEMKKE